MHPLEKYLESRNLTQAEFGKLIGSGQESVSRYISGHRYPRPKVLAKIIAETGGAVTASDFLPSDDFASDDSRAAMSVEP